MRFRGGRPRPFARIEALAHVRSVLRRNGGIAPALHGHGRHPANIVLSIATRPSQFDAILSWSRSVQDERILCIPSVHPADPLAAERVRIAAEEGFRGLKFHPYYQDFDLDDPAMDSVYGAMEDHHMICVSHRLRPCVPVRSQGGPGADPACPRQVPAIVFRGDPPRGLEGLGARGTAPSRGPPLGGCRLFPAVPPRRRGAAADAAVPRRPPAVRVGLPVGRPGGFTCACASPGARPVPGARAAGRQRACSFLFVRSRSLAYTLTYIFLEGRTR